MVLKHVLLTGHILSGVASSIACIFLFNAVMYKNKRSLQFWSSRDLYCNLLATFFGGAYYYFYYPEIKKVILNGPFDLSHHVFMESKEHLFIILLMLSIYLNVIIRYYRSEKVNWSLVKVASLSMLLLGLYMSISGMFISFGARVAWELASK